MKFLAILIALIAIPSVACGQVTKITNGTLVQQVNLIAGTVYQNPAEVLHVDWDWKIDTGAQSVTGTLAVFWAGQSQVTTNVYVPANSTNFPVSVVSDYTLPNPVPNTQNCNMTLSIAGSPGLVQSAAFTKQGQGGGGPGGA